MITEPGTSAFAVSEIGQKTYRPTGGWAMLLRLFGIIAMIAGALGIIYFGTGHETPTRASLVVFVSMSAGFFILGTYLIGELLQSRVVLTLHSIELRHLLGTALLNRSDVRGWRTLPSSPPTLVLVPGDKSKKKMKIAHIYNFDEVLDHWLEGLPNLDALERQKAEKEIEANAELGFNDDERTRTIRNERHKARAVNIVCVAIAAWAWAYPEPYTVLMAGLATAPLAGLAVAARSRGLVRIDRNRNDPYPSVAFAVLIPGFILMLRAILDLHLLPWHRAAMLSVCAALPFYAAAMASDSALRQKTANAILFAFLSLPYGFGSILEFNALADHSSAAVFRANILSKQVESGGKHTAFKLRLAPWGPQNTPTFYRAVHAGDQICLPVRSGALEIPWYKVTFCPPL